MSGTFREIKGGDRCPGSLTTFLRKFNQGAKAGELNVPCNGCTACCRDPKLVVDISEEEARRLKSHRDDKTNKGWALDRNEKGECVYLIDNRCSIYFERPKVCRTYDCRMHILGIPIPYGISDQDILIKEGLSQWSQFSLPTTEDRIMGLAIRFSLIATMKENPEASGHEIALALKNWGAYREIARQMYDALHGYSADEIIALLKEAMGGAS